MPVKPLSRRSHGVQPAGGKQHSPVMDIKEHKLGRFTLQPFRQLLDQGRPVPVKPKALAILSVLAEADGALVTKDELMAAIWPNITVEDNAIQVHVVSLR
jgi:DNA-binding winged helix-turn-helix (wHTH) protein